MEKETIGKIDKILRNFEGTSPVFIYGEKEKRLFKSKSGLKVKINEQLKKRSGAQ